MKFEQFLKSFWLKGYYFSNTLLPFEVSLDKLLKLTQILSRLARNILVNRFELFQNTNKKDSILELNWRQQRVINVFLSQTLNIQTFIWESFKSRMIRLYLIKSTRGKCHALGKPSRGQRSVSNAWSAYHCNKTTRIFINEVKEVLARNKEKVVIDYKKTKKKDRSKKKKDKSLEFRTKVKKLVWF
jgi:ribosomal protein S13